MIRGFVLSCLLLFPAGLCADIVSHEGTSYYVYRLDPKTETLELHLAAKRGEPNKFPDLKSRIEKDGRVLKFAMNAGIFEGTFLPTGLHISDGKTVVKLNREEFKKEREGEFTPNFYLKPNGVFFIRKDKTAAILETEAFAHSAEKPELATQSGPLLVANGTIHPVLEPASTSERYRNGVGVARDGTVVLVCSVLDRKLGMSNLYRFAELFRDKLDCPNALYLDGDISYVYIAGETPPIQETNWFAGILAVTESAP